MPKPPEMTHSSSFWGCIKPIGLRAFKVAFCDLEACSSARAGRGNKMRTLAVYPVNTLYTRYLAEMLGVVSDYGQSKMTSSNSYKNIELTNNNTLTCERLTNFSIIAHPITKREDGKSLFNFFRFLKVSLYGFAVESSISEFRNTYLRCKYLYSD